MKGWQILQFFSERGKNLSVSGLYGYVRKGYVSPPAGPLNSLSSEYPETAAGEAWAARRLLPATGPAMLILSREIGLHILKANYTDPWRDLAEDIAEDLQLAKLIRNRPDAAFYAAAWLIEYFEFQGTRPPVDLAQLRIALMAFATPDDIVERQAEWNKKDIAEIAERTRLEDLEDEKDLPERG